MTDDVRQYAVERLKSHGIVLAQYPEFRNKREVDAWIEHLDRLHEMTERE